MAEVEDQVSMLLALADQYKQTSVLSMIVLIDKHRSFMSTSVLTNE